MPPKPESLAHQAFRARQPTPILQQGGPSGMSDRSEAGGLPEVTPMSAGVSVEEWSSVLWG